jgi:hypothetical protein
LDGGVLDFIIIGIRKRKEIILEYSKIQNFGDIWKIKNINIFLSGVIGNISRQFMSKGS